VGGRLGWRPAATNQTGQHYLASRQLAAELAQAADLGPEDLVLELGAGFGRLTAEIAPIVRNVVAVELDPGLAHRLASRFATHPAVRVVHADALEVALPRRPFRVLSNPPFHVTARLLRRLLNDPRVPLVRADLVLDWRAAIGLAATSPPSWRSMGWQPWYEFLLLRRLPSDSFRPEPSVDAALLSIRRRRSVLLPPGEAASFRRWLRGQPHLDVWTLVSHYRRRMS
jgi:23S rRNA (adenine-N6)-dimethyltransferase